MIKSLEYCHPAPELPWLMLCSHPSSSIDDCFLSLSDGKVHKLLLPSNPNSFSYIRERERERERVRVRVQCFGSIEGLLIMVDNQNDYFFWNPISGDRLMLPSLKCQCGTGNCSTLKFAASSKPTRRVRRSQQQQPPCFVVSLCSLGRLAFCMPTDRSWNSIDEEGKPHFDDIVIVHGKLYAATRWWPRSSSALTVFDIIFQEDVNICTSDFIPGQPRYRVEKQVLLHSWWPRIPLVLPWRNNNDRYISLAQDYASMELFMIHHQVTYDSDSDWQMLRRHIYSGNCIKPPKTKGFRVLKLNSTNEGGPPWEEVADLGDRILFVSNVGNKFISTNSANSALNHGERLERNCIYFVLIILVYNQHQVNMISGSSP
ncbi:PREDICTED: putative F-box [Prunus dulcis]|uniref:PREDICTED: putative F-box n=1 Tax=Prunus dulcis TaxID=3755 RepID=A0A5E4EA30_PRUDU|nr:PREDICTED: putative F-box [Prunus dulcis]